MSPRLTLKKTSIAASLCLIASFSEGAWAQSELKIYGTVDVAVDHVQKGQGDISGSFFQTLPLILQSSPNAAVQAKGRYLASLLNSAYADQASLTRVSPSIASQSALGIRGVEDIGGGYKSNFVLEGQFSADTGAENGEDSRMWGRQAYVGLTTPYGEWRLGRQYAPMFYAYALNSVEAIGASDIMASGMVVNNLQIRQDNQISYWLKGGGFIAAVAYSPNAGVDKNISILRSGSAVAGSPNGQIIGGATAGAESANSGSRGQSIGAFLNYTSAGGLLVNGGYHFNRFGDAKLVDFATAIPLMSLDKYLGYTMGIKYVLPNLGTQLASNFSYGKFTNDPGSVEGAKVETITLGVKQPIGPVSIGAEFAFGEFTNFTQGKDSSMMLGGDYRFSKRTMLYMRAGYVKDMRGHLAQTDGVDPTGANMQVIGGPAPLLFGLGSTELPFFAGGGLNIGATTTVIAVGLRHDF